MAAKKLRELIRGSEILVCPGVYDGISGRIALSKKFKCLYMTGAGTVASRFGMPDIGVAGQTDMHANASLLANLDANVPLIADADTGYGNAVMCARTLTMYARAGVAGLHVEDQVQAKRCGHLGGKELVSEEEFVMRIRAMAIARNNTGSDIVIIARSDALQSFGVDEAIQRCKSAINAGADVAFVEGITNQEEATQIVRALSPTPVLINLVTNGVTPNWTASQAQEMGFKICIYPCASIMPASIAIGKAMDELLDDGTDAKSCQGVNPREFFMQMGLKDAIVLERLVGSSTFNKI
jgi:2-methylisocitrate lyase-like PEP mutase family enzyme